MSLYFVQNEDASQQRALNAQWMDVNQQRLDAERNGYGVMGDLLRRTVGLNVNGHIEQIFNGQLIRTPVSMAVNMGVTPKDSYLEFDRVSDIIKNPVGEFSTLGKVMRFSRSVNIGRRIFEYRQVSALANKAKTSMKGQSGVLTDHTSVSYAGTLVPIHDYGYGRDFRELEGMRADGYDALVDDAREADLVIRRKLVDGLWNGFVDENGQPLVVKGKSWTGVKSDSTVAQVALTVNMLASATTADQIYEQIKALRDVMRIENNMSLDMELAVSRELYSKFEQPFSTYDRGFGSVLEMIRSLAGISEVYEDPALTGNEVALFHFGFEGMSAITGMAMSTVAVPRQMYNDDYSFIKACATGFLARTDYDDHKTVLYATGP